VRALRLAGMRFGRLTVIERWKNVEGRSAWLCSCDCGKPHIAMGKLLNRGHTKSCGCLKLDGSARVIHGHSRRGRMSRTYKSWAKMIERCTNPNCKDYPNYHGRGITIYEPWMKFENFLNYMGECPEKLELDRVDPNGNYEPGNVRWADEYTQSINRNWTQWIAIEEEMVPMKVASQRLGLSYAKLKKLTSILGLSGQQAVTALLEGKI